MAEAIEQGNESMGTSKTVMGALPYMAPEMISDTHIAEKPVDIWSLGAMMYELLTGMLPFGNGLKAVPKILNAELPERPALLDSCNQLKDLANNLYEIILKCLDKDPGDRPVARDLVTACEDLCYAQDPRIEGVVYRYPTYTWGFIEESDGTHVFFHKASVYGSRPSVGDRVTFAKYHGGGADRAFPVLKLRE